MAARPPSSTALNEQIGRRVRRLTAVRRDRRLLRRRYAPAARGLLLRAGARGAQPRDDDGPVPARRRRGGGDPRLAAPETDFADIVEPVALALEQERAVGEQIVALAALAREESDYQSEQFMQWFLKEQVEEVATMSSLLDVVERDAGSPDLVEDYLAREHARGRGRDPTAPTGGGRRALAAR